MLVIFKECWWYSKNVGDKKSNVGDIDRMLVMSLKCWWAERNVGDILNHKLKYEIIMFYCKVAKNKYKMNCWDQIKHQSWGGFF